ncbi:MAG: NHLP leader peptide family RiPP precursor [Candidatus Muirbacterium halophilum]|nr:NHLP leader peptide family RiPP precursor [Candidatus Muirbacterium halophilum]MCK9476149.1 NHLP leader peptide family RiPP precursor [Candidatus Muirbacterium halophilum]
MNWTNAEVKKVLNQIKSKAATDKEFRKKVLLEPEIVIKDISGKQIPSNFKISIIENKKGIDQTYVLPDFIGEELTDEQLDNVAGGRGGCSRDCGDYHDYSRGDLPK